MELFAEQFSKDSIGIDDEENISDQSESKFILKNLEDLNYKHAGKLVKIFDILASLRKKVL